MKYSEARQILEKNGMKLDTECGGETNCITCNDHTVAIFSKETCYISDTNWDNDYANKYQIAIAQKVAYELSRTKPEDREDKSKKYYLRIFDLSNKSNNHEGYLNLKRNNKYIVSDNLELYYYKVQFTDDEIKKMEKDPVLKNIDLEKCKEPVED